MSLAQRIIRVLLQEEDFDISPEEMRSMVRPHLATFAPMFQRHKLLNLHVHQWHTQIESDSKDMLAFVSILEKAQGDIKEPNEFHQDWQGTSISIEISLMGRRGEEWLPAERMKFLNVLKTYPENRPDVIDMVKNFVDVTLRGHMNGHRTEDGGYDWKAVIEGIQYSLSDLVEATAKSVPRLRSNAYREWRSRIMFGESMDDEDVQGFVDTALGFGSVIPRNVPKRDVHFDHFSRQYNIGMNLGAIYVNAYHKFYHSRPNVAMFKANLRTLMLSDESFDVEVDMSKGASEIIAITRNFLKELETLQAEYAGKHYSYENGSDLKMDVEALFHRVVNALKPYTIFVKI